MHRAPKRAALRAHGHNTHSQYPLPALGTTLASKATRAGVAERFADPAVHKSIEVDLARITSYDALLRAVALTLLKTAKPHDAHTLYRLQTVPGMGKMLSLVLLYASHRRERCPRGQACVSYCRLVQCAKEAHGKRSGTSGATSGKAHLKWALAEAAVLGLRDNPAAQQSLARLEKKPDKGTALTILAHKLARAVYERLTRKVAFDTETFCQPYGRGAEEPEASLANQGVNLQQALDTAACLASVNAQVPIGQDTRSPSPLLGHPLSLLCAAAMVANGPRGRLLPRP
jgi:hypothetical protein